MPFFVEDFNFLPFSSFFDFFWSRLKKIRLFILGQSKHVTEQTAFINVIQQQYLSYIVLQPRKLFQRAFTKTPLLDSKHARWKFLEFWSSRIILSVHANVTDAASTMVSTLSSGGGLTSGPGWVIGRIGRVPGGPLHFWAGREFYFLTFVTLVHLLLK